MTETLLFNRDASGIATITFNRPEAHNALSRAMMDAFSEVTKNLAADAGLRVVIVTGAGETAFCSGGDLMELSQRPTEQDALEFITLMGNALSCLENLPVPVIGAINGYALGGGSEIAVACDLRIADRAVRIGFVHVRLALTPGWGAGQRLLRLVGYSRAMDLLLSGHIMHAEELLQMGLANRVVEQGTALEHALSFARLVADHPPQVIRGIKALLKRGLVQPYEESLAFEQSLFPPLWAADAHLMAMERFLMKDQSEKEKA